GPERAVLRALLLGRRFRYPRVRFSILESNFLHHANTAGAGPRFKTDRQQTVRRYRICRRRHSVYLQPGISHSDHRPGRFARSIHGYGKYLGYQDSLIGAQDHHTRTDPGAACAIPAGYEFRTAYEYGIGVSSHYARDQ